MKTKQQYELELKRLLETKNRLEGAVKKVDSMTFPDRWRIEFRNFKRAEREYTKMLDEYVAHYSKT
jgi:hypothetical protein